MNVIIPARYDSERLPGKPLRMIAGKPLLQHVHEVALASGAENIVIATDDERIRTAALGFGAHVCMTSREHRSGTERIAEVVRVLALADSEIIVNLQGDEPLMPPALIVTVAEALATHPQAAVATVRHAIDDEAAMLDPNIVKVVCDADGFALYFSRAPIPWRRDTGTRAHGESIGAFRHIGLYAYRAGFVSRYAAWEPCALEQIERLEQLRALWYGERIIVCDAPQLPGPGVDTPEGLERVRKIIEKGEE
jgi:3-deoxy-manno-octulosonate cytidylyltransferase (CMP-KDO synthetase)